MSVNGSSSRTVRTRRGDTIVVSLIRVCDEEPTLFVTVDDVDDSPMPTAELTIQEAAELREVMRALSEEAVRMIEKEGAWRAMKR